MKKDDGTRVAVLVRPDAGTGWQLRPVCAKITCVKPNQPGLDLPAKIASYRIEQRLGSGGMGVVYRAFDEALQRPLAIKHLQIGKSVTRKTRDGVALTRGRVLSSFLPARSAIGVAP